MSEFKRDFSSVEELEKLLDEEFISEEEITDEDATEDEIEETEVEETEEIDEVVEENNDEVEEETQEEVTTAPQETTKPKKENKQEFAFKKLREEAQTYKEELNQTKAKLVELDRLDKVAKQYGYSSYDEMLKTLEQQAIEKEAKEQNIDPKVYQRLKELEDKAQKAEQERLATIQQAKVEKFVTSLDSFAKENSLTDDDKQKILSGLDDDGWQLDQLVNVKNPKNIFKGYVADILAEKKTQKTLNDIKKNSKYSEDTFKNQGQVDKSIDELVDADLKKWAKANGYTY